MLYLSATDVMLYPEQMLHVLQFCDTDCESLKIRTLLVRLYIASNEHQKAIAQFSIAMDDVLPDRPSTIPETVEDIAAMVSAMESRADVALSEREQLEVGIISLVAFCG
jgi:pyruvate-formate lyase-activating enzyme